MSKIIAAGHICLDITPVIPAEHKCTGIGEMFVPGKLIQTDPAIVHTGGSVANTGIALKLLGNEVSLLGKVGDDAFGRMVSDLLSAYGAGGLIVDAESSTSYSVVLALPGIDRIFLHNPGANNTFSASDIPDEALHDAVLFHFGYPPIMRRMYIDGGAELTGMFRKMKELGIATSLDLAAVDPQSEAGKQDWEKILRNVLPYVDFFVPSIEELCYMLDRDRYDSFVNSGGDMTVLPGICEEAERFAKICIDMGCGTALIKCGLSGMVYRTAGTERIRQIGNRLKLDTGMWADRHGYQPCYRAEVVRSTSGAGDVSIAAYLTAMMNGGNPAACAALAAAEGAASVTAYDALGGIQRLDELQKRIDQGWETVKPTRQ